MGWQHPIEKSFLIYRLVPTTTTKFPPFQKNSTESNPAKFSLDKEVDTELEGELVPTE